MRATMVPPLLILCLAVPAAGAADRPWWQFWGDVAGSAADAAADTAARETMDRRFTPEQQTLLRDFLRDHRQGDGRYADRRDDRHDDDGYGRDKPKQAKPLPPGLRRKLERGGELPPGWQKKLARGEVVDGEVWRQSHRLPPDLLRRLGPLPRDTEIRYVEDKVYRVMRDSHEIVDILGL